MADLPLLLQPLEGAELVGGRDVGVDPVELEQVDPPDPEPLQAPFAALAEVLRAPGCSACRRTGYRGRIAAFETLPASPELEQAIYENASADEIRQLTRRPTLLQDGMRKVIAGVTSLEEVLKVTGA